MADITTPLTEDEWLQQVRDGLGDPDPGDAAIVSAYTKLDGQIPVLWRMYADKQGQGYRIRHLYVKRDAIDFLLGHMWQAVTNSDSDVSESLSDLFSNLNTLKDGIDNQLLSASANRVANRGPAVGMSYATAPIEPVCGRPDPNDRIYRGDPVRRAFRITR